MPRGDRTGPNGMGPMTGRAMGYCAGFNSPGFTNPGGGRGMGMGMGRGGGRGMGFRRGYGNAAYPPATNINVNTAPENDAYAAPADNFAAANADAFASISGDIRALAESVEKLNKRIDALETPEPSEDK